MVSKEIKGKKQKEKKRKERKKNNEHLIPDRFQTEPGTHFVLKSKSEVL